MDDFVSDHHGGFTGRLTSDGADSLRLSVSRDGDTFTITASGDLDFATASRLLGCMNSAFPHLSAGTDGNGDVRGRERRRAGLAGARVVIDLGGIAFIDAFGLGTLVSMHNWADRRRLSFVLANPSAMVRRLLAITGLADHFAEAGDLAAIGGTDLSGSG